METKALPSHKTVESHEKAFKHLGAAFSSIADAQTKTMHYPLSDKVMKDTVAAGKHVGRAYQTLRAEIDDTINILKSIPQLQAS